MAAAVKSIIFFIFSTLHCLCAALFLLTSSRNDELSKVDCINRSQLERPTNRPPVCSTAAAKAPLTLQTATLSLFEFAGAESNRI